MDPKLGPPPATAMRSEPHVPATGRPGRQRVWFVTGVSRGLGHAIAAAVLAAGDTVIGTTHQSGSAFPASDRLHTIPLDLLDNRAIAPALERAFALRGRIDVLVNNAAVRLFGAIEEADDDQVTRLFDLNVHAPRRVLQAALPFLRQQGRGWIVNVTSVAGYDALPGMAYYAASKSAFETLTAVLASEVAPFGIRVTAIVPGALRANFAPGASYEAATGRLDGYDVAHESIGRYEANSGRQPGDPDRIARTILALADHPDPPRRLLLGSDALARAHGHVERLLADAAAHEAVTRATDHGCEDAVGRVPPARPST